MERTSVDRIYTEYRGIVELLASQGETSFENAYKDIFRKSLLLSAASHFEYRLINGVIDFSTRVAGKNTMIPAIIKAKVTDRNYHTWFDWKVANANHFFSMFGQEFKSYMGVQLKEASDLGNDIAAFMEIGRDRNRLVHQDYASFTIEKTATEIYERYQQGERFVSAVLLHLDACAQLMSNSGHSKIED